MKTIFFRLGLVVACSSALTAAPLTESTFTEVVKDVNIVAATTKAATAARVQAVVKAPDLVRTGPESRAELTAPDQTITRVGANTVFSFESAGRNINLERGSLLFHSPSGKGGGTIKSGGAAAAVLGTTLIVAAMPGGGFKVIVLEGRARVILENGKRVTLREGQIIFILAGQGASEVMPLNLGRLVAGSLLVNGFGNALPSLTKIKQAIEQQEKLLARGGAEDTGLTPENFARQRSGAPANGIVTLDDNSYALGLMGWFMAPRQEQFPDVSWFPPPPWMLWMYGESPNGTFNPSPAPVVLSGNDTAGLAAGRSSSMVSGNVDSAVTMKLPPPIPHRLP